MDALMSWEMFMSGGDSDDQLIANEIERRGWLRVFSEREMRTRETTFIAVLPGRKHKRLTISDALLEDGPRMTALDIIRRLAEAPTVDSYRETP